MYVVFIVLECVCIDIIKCMCGLCIVFECLYYSYLYKYY